jgi:DNA-binding CsgD family transcriptional regulator
VPARQGAHGYLSKTLPAHDLVDALEAVHAGDIVISDPPGRSRAAVGVDWPGRREGLTDREAEILALISQGRSNADVAALTFLSPNTVQSYIRTMYRELGVASRTQAVLWGVHNGFTPDHHRIDHLARRSVIRLRRYPMADTASWERWWHDREGRGRDTLSATP